MPSKRPTHAEQLAAIKRPDKLFRLIGENAKLLAALRGLYTEHAALLMLGTGHTSPAYGQAAKLLKELEPKSETDGKSPV